MESSPLELEPYEKAYKLKRQAEDERDWTNGIYTLRAIEVALSNAFNKESKAEYFDKPIMQQTNEDKAKKDTESNELLATAEFMQFAKAMSKQGLPTLQNY